MKIEISKGIRSDLVETKKTYSIIDENHNVIFSIVIDFYKEKGLINGNCLDRRDISYFPEETETFFDRIKELESIIENDFDRYDEFKESFLEIIDKD